MGVKVVSAAECDDVPKRSPSRALFVSVYIKVRLFRAGFILSS